MGRGVYLRVGLPLLLAAAHCCTSSRSCCVSTTIHVDASAPSEVFATKLCTSSHISAIRVLRLSCHSVSRQASVVCPCPRSPTCTYINWTYTSTRLYRVAYSRVPARGSSESLMESLSAPQSTQGVIRVIRDPRRPAVRRHSPGVMSTADSLFTMRTIT